MSHGTHRVTRLRVNEQPKSALCCAMASSQWAVRLSCLASSSVSRSDRVRCQPPWSVTSTISAMGLRGFGKLVAGGFRRASALAVELIGFRCMGAHAVGGDLWRHHALAQPARGFPKPCGPLRGCRRGGCKHRVGAGIAVRVGNAVRPQSPVVCLDRPNRGGVRQSRPKPRSGGATAPAFTA